MTNTNSSELKVPSGLIVIQLVIPAVLGFFAFKTYRFEGADIPHNDTWFVLAVYAATNWHVVGSVILGISAIASLIAIFTFEDSPYRQPRSVSQIVNEKIGAQLSITAFAIIFAALIFSGVVWKAYTVKMIWLTRP